MSSAAHCEMGQSKSKVRDSFHQRLLIAARKGDIATLDQAVETHINVLDDATLYQSLVCAAAKAKQVATVEHLFTMYPHIRPHPAAHYAAIDGEWHPNAHPTLRERIGAKIMSK
ncbi:hypothetical protein FH972_023306 [Carpinus fangiana]|uniref:Uncharacterized protein n=1 Tax=Carpinus fangiana TaxID=176857 RepID=A0A5N6KV33_9ROSI|nr:hypothetical protein FH972_023306 [Carpinus fangiana]